MQRPSLIGCTDVVVRHAGLGDSEALGALDTVAQCDAERRQLIDEWLRRDTVLVAEMAGRAVGYGVCNRGFFHQWQVEMLMVAEEARGRGVGAALLTALERECSGPKLFVTTNASNRRMQRLLLRAGYTACGYVNELDPGDPELVFVKRLAKE